MGKRKGISAEIRRRWLEQNEGGKTASKIAEDDDSDIRTVKHHLQLAREAREATQARLNFVFDRIERHQNDLLTDAERLHKLLLRRFPVVLTPDDPLQKRIFDALKEHAKGLPLKKHLDKWDEALDQYLENRNGVKMQLEVEEHQLISAIPEEAGCYPWAPAILGVLESGVLFEETRRSYVEEPVDGKYRISWGTNILTRPPVTAEQKVAVLEAHARLVEFGKKYESGFQEYLRRFRGLAEPIVDELEIIKMKRHISGRCRYCPA